MKTSWRVWLRTKFLDDTQVQVERRSFGFRFDASSLNGTTVFLPGGAPGRTGSRCLRTSREEGSVERAMRAPAAGRV